MTTATVESMKHQLLMLPVPDRAELAQFLLHSLQATVDPEEESAWDDELSRRIDEIESGADAGELSDAVFEELRAKYSS